MIFGDSAWSLMVELDSDEVIRYVEDRRRHGFNTVLVELIEHNFSSDPPNNVFGDGPFLVPGDFSTPNERYFEHVDWVLEQLERAGFVVLLTADYLGWGGGSDGWYQDMVDNGPEVMEAYGRFVGERYARFDNIIWVSGGDYEPEDESVVDAVAEGIAEADPDALHTAHLAPDIPPRAFWSGSDWLDIDNVYTYGAVYDSALAAYQETSMPYFLLESTYENEHDSTTLQLRTQAFHALLTGATGHVFGNNPIWHFGSGGIWPAPVSWEEALDGPGSRSMAAIAAFMSNIEWWRLRPDIDGDLLVDGLHGGDFVTDDLRGGHDRAVASLADDGAWAVVYVPTRRTLSLDLGLIAGPRARLTWFDPATNDQISSTVVAADGVVDVDTPAPGTSSDEDALLLIEAE